MHKTTQVAFFFLLTLLGVVLFAETGCHEKKVEKKQTVKHREMTSDQSEELFKQSIDTLNHLDDNFGPEILTHVLGRLDRWVLSQNPDKSWVADPFFAEQEKNIAGISEKLRLLSSQIKKLSETPAENQPAITAADVRQAAETAKAVREQLVQSYNTLGVQRFLDHAQMAAGIEGIVGPLATVAQNRNLGAKEIGDYFKNQIQQQGTETAQIVVGMERLADVFALYAETFRGDSLSFRGIDGDYLKQAIWCRNAAGWARGDRQDDLERAKELFDWTVRNIMMFSRIQQQPQQPSQQPVVIAPAPQAAWEAMLFGKGNVADWANVFVELLRQQRIDACILGVEVQTGQNIKVQVPWGVGVLIDQNIYVFLVRFGVPLTLEQDMQLDPEKGLVFSKVVTLAELRANPGLLKGYIGGTFTAEQADAMLKDMRLMIPANPITQSQRMKIIEKALTGANKTVIYSVYAEQKERFAKVMPDAPIQIWSYPFETNFENCLNRGVQDLRLLPFMMPALQDQPFSTSQDKQEQHPLWKGRLLYLAGKKSGETGASVFLQHARVSERKLQEMPQLLSEQFVVYKMATATANYWLGQIAFEESREPYNSGDRVLSLSASNDYASRVLNAPLAQEWSYGALYQMGRVCECQGKYDEAIKYYTFPSQEPDAVGRLFRANQLKRLRP